MPSLLQILESLRYGKAGSEEADFYIQRTDGSGDAFYSPDIQCGIPESIV